MQIGLSFLFFLSIMTLAGYFAVKKSSASTDDYLLAGRNVSAIPMALSALASKISGFMFIGMLGYIYKVGFSSIWFLVAWIFSDWVIWRFFYAKIREKSETENITTVTAFAASCIKPRDDSNHRNTYFLKVLAVIVIIFMGVYAAAQLSAGAKALESVLSISYNLNVIMAAVLIAAYCFAGGIRASIWTDTVQAVLMFLSMIFLAFVAVFKCGGIQNLFNSLGAIDLNLVHWIPDDLSFGFVIFLLGRIANGFALLGQPHIVVRAMLIKDLKSFRVAELTYFIYYIVFCIALFFVALAARVILPDLINSDPELALLSLSNELLPQILIGLILAGVFYSTISTADSQILSCTAGISQDLFPSIKDKYWTNKIITLGILLFTTILALMSNESVFSLTMFGWVSLGVVFAPLILLKIIDIKLESKIIIISSLLSLIISLFWGASPWHHSVNEVLIGFVTFLIFSFSLNKIFK